MSDMERAREIAHMFTKCTGGRPAGDDGHRWHTKTCDERSHSIAAALAAARREALEDAARACDAKSREVEAKRNNRAQHFLGAHLGCELCAAAIRALIEKEQT